MPLIQTTPKVETSRRNAPGVVASTGTNRTAQIITTILGAAGSANASFPLFQAGDNFYLPIATGAVYIKPNTSAENQYSQGTGQRYPDGFSSLQITNKNPFSIVISIFVGFGDYIDNRVILFNPLEESVPTPVYTVPSSAADIFIPDRSGQAITDPSGVTYLALSRQFVFFSNLDLADVYTLSDFSSGTIPVLAIQPQTSIQFPASTNLRAKFGHNINGLISETYLAVLPSQLIAP